MFRSRSFCIRNTWSGLYPRAGRETRALPSPEEHAEHEADEQGDADAAAVAKPDEPGRLLRDLECADRRRARAAADAATFSLLVVGPPATAESVADVRDRDDGPSVAFDGVAVHGLG